MCNTKNNIENIATHRGIYRVWSQTCDNGTPELVSVWIDPAMRTFEAQMVAQEPALAGSLDLSTDDEPPGGIALMKMLLSSSAGK
jgi:hypothetical protein